MNFLILRALFEDARQQVLDNKVFRLLIFLTAVPILFTFLVGFHEESISLFWGWKTISYETLMKTFGGTGQAGTEELSTMFIQVLQTLILSVFVGMFGMMLSIAATAFFAPKILEKGSADTLFSKPVSRMAILLSRYFAGILFVAFLSAALVFGMYLGLLINSDYNDPGFLWGALTLVYLYSMMHAFSVAVAVLTRSSTAAILTTIFFFMICGAVHGGWQSLSYFEQQEFVAQLRSGGAEEADDEEGDAEDEAEEDQSGILQVLTTSLKVAHFVFPKTSDADMITQKLRRAITEKSPVIATKDTELIMKLGPAGFTLVEESLANFETDGVVWRTETDAEVSDSVRFRRYKRPLIEKKVASRTRTRLQTAKDVSKALELELSEAGYTSETESRSLSRVRTILVTWTTPDDSLSHSRYIFHFGDWLYAIDMDLAQEGSPRGEHRRWRREFLYNGNIVLGQVAGMRPDAWYASKFNWDAEWKYNIFFSIGSSLAFIVAMLSVAWLKLRRIDF